MVSWPNCTHPIERELVGGTYAANTLQLPLYCKVRELLIETDVYREFFRCSKPIGEQCSFFQWVDSEPRTPEIRTSTLPPTPTSGLCSFGQTNPGSPPSPALSIKRNIQDLEDEHAHDCKRPRDSKAFGSQESLRLTIHFAMHITILTKAIIGISIIKTPTPVRVIGVLPGLKCHLEELVGILWLDKIAMISSSSQETLGDESGPSTDMSLGTIRDVVHKLNVIPDYVQKLDRKRIAAEKSRDTKKSKIESLTTRVQSLEEEVKKLKAREKELEEVIAAYEQ
ncbi:hypothetical protein JR316_0002024 [Psilocybe cubensis]|uniref:Uncharacterized protein n=1 Tax=Psilocybe cubensis TaxID=181762 RepID=A0ACB8HBP6_PSICU|nr:hypothetical protein JR316_0002024 [Psilocybe cubensis]KAH9485117.1 hypothetical protein JR316_0002024 [Psilocybe cubensis]